MPKNLRIFNVTSVYPQRATIDLIVSTTMSNLISSHQPFWTITHLALILVGDVNLDAEIFFRCRNLADRLRFDAHRPRFFRSSERVFRNNLVVAAIPDLEPVDGYQPSAFGPGV